MGDKRYRPKIHTLLRQPEVLVIAAYLGVDVAVDFAFGFTERDLAGLILLLVISGGVLVWHFLATGTVVDRAGLVVTWFARTRYLNWQAVQEIRIERGLWMAVAAYDANGERLSLREVPADAKNLDELRRRWVENRGDDWQQTLHLPELTPGT